jgi:hypothetical protein
MEEVVLLEAIPWSQPTYCTVGVTPFKRQQKLSNKTKQTETRKWVPLNFILARKS